MALTALVTACVHAPLHVGRAPVETLASTIDVARPQNATHAPLSIVLFSDANAVGVDPTTGAELWRRPIRAFGPPVVVDELVIVPVYGHRAIALDARTGVTRWQQALPGQVLTGLTASDRGVLVTALQPDPRRATPKTRRTRSIVGAMNLSNGHIRWTRASPDLLGVPAAVGRTGFVPAEGAVVALSMRTGRILGTMASSVEIERVERHGDTVLGSDGEVLIDLAVGTRYDYEQDEGRIFASVDGIEPGLGHQPGVRFLLLPPKGAGGPRDALILSRRALFFIRLDERGRLARARWIHLRQDQHEYVEVHLLDDEVLLVRDDGGIVRLDRATGRLQNELAGVVPASGAAFAGRPSLHTDTADSVDVDTVDALLAGLLEDPDPRLVPAQRIALKLMWRSPRPDTRRHVKAVASGSLRAGPEHEEAALIKHARELAAGPWGRANKHDARELAIRLQSPQTRGRTLRDAARDVVLAGSSEALAALTTLLEQPGLTAPELDDVARALRDLDDAASVPQAARFVAQYHADPEIVDASMATYYLVELLISHASPRMLPGNSTLEAQAIAQDTLDAVAADSFTVPALRAFIDAHRQRPGSAQGNSERPGCCT